MDIAETVDPKWETHHGHAHATTRYGAMSRPRPSGPPEEHAPDDEEGYANWRKQQLLLKHDAKVGTFERRRYQWV